MSIYIIGYSSILLTLGMISTILSSLYSIICMDIKRIVAYFSVILMSIIFISLFLSTGVSS